MAGASKNIEMKSHDNKNSAEIANAAKTASIQRNRTPHSDFVDNRPSFALQRKMQELANQSSRTQQGFQFKQAIQQGNSATPHSISSREEGANNSIQLKASKPVQFALDEREEVDKLRILKDYVRFTPPSKLQYGPYNKPPEKDYEYVNALIAKITADPNLIESMKTKRNMHADVQDDAWGAESFNVTTLKQAVAAIHPKYSKYSEGDGEEIGRETEEFEGNDCVFAAIAVSLGYADSLAVEEKIAAYFNHKKGTVEDSILYRMMEELGWDFYGDGRFDDLFRPEKESGVYQYPPIGGKFVISENKNVGGTEGHVLTVDIENDLDRIFDPLSKTIKLVDRQYERRHEERARSAAPTYKVYAWKVRNTSAAKELKKYIDT